MARASFTETIAAISPDGTMKAISNVQVDVYHAGTTNHATIWDSRSAGSQLTNPIVTGAGGFVQFWVDSGDYDIKFTDLAGLPRISTTTIGWQSNPIEADVKIGFDVGDVKFSSKSSDHGRWLKMDGRELSQAGVESALGLVSGEGYDITAALGTGSSSLYGIAASGKIKLPDTRRSMPMMAGPSGDGPGGLTARPLTNTGGQETVTLTGSQSGMPSHGHTASSGNATPTITITDPGHAHTVSGNTSSQGHHVHGIGAGVTNTIQGGGSSRVLSSLQDHQGVINSSLSSPEPGWTTQSGGHSHTVSGSAASVGTGISAAQSAHNHTVSVSAADAQNASSSHTNMPPFVTIGYCFIRV